MEYSSPFWTKIRAIGSSLGVLRPLVRFYRKVLNIGYEESFDQAFIGSINTADVVWDVGANEGHYVSAAAERTTGAGLVVAIEPSPRSIAGLRASWADVPHVRLMPMALSSGPGTMPFYYGDTPYTDSLGHVEGREPDALVTVLTADMLSDSTTPDVIKIDVEGFELEVLQGASRLLAAKVPRSIFIEVHFQASAARGVPNAPHEVVGLLRGAGYAVKWLDPSHLRADRT